MNVLILNASVLLLLASPLVQACELRHVYEDWPPYLYRSGANKVTGLDLDLVAAIAREAKCQLTTLPTMTPMQRDLLFRDGSVNLIFAASDLAERRIYARFSISYRSETVRLFATPAKLAGYRALHGLDAIDARRLTLLVPATGWYGPAYARLAPQLKQRRQLRTFNNLDQGMRMMAAGRADLLMGDGPGISYLSAHGELKLMALPYVVNSAPVHLMLSKASTTPDDVARINAAILTLERNGTLAAIRASYL